MDASHQPRTSLTGCDTPPHAPESSGSLAVPAVDGVHFTFSSGSEEARAVAASVQKDNSATQSGSAVSKDVAE